MKPITKLSYQQDDNLKSLLLIKRSEQKEELEQIIKLRTSSGHSATDQEEMIKRIDAVLEGLE